MLKEIAKEIVLQNKGESNCRWFRDDYFDLFIWYNDTNEITSFQLYYDIYHHQRAVFWKEKSGYSHHSIDSGENRPGKLKATPIVIENGQFDKIKIAETFKKNCTDIDTEVSGFIINKILSY